VPIYDYRCEACGASFEVFQKFSEDPVQTCEVCGGGPVVKVLHPVAVHFKGSGFYTTDYGRSSSFRSQADREAGGSASGGSETSGGSGDGGSAASDKPAAAEKGAAGNGSSATKAGVKEQSS
jgi:putative FmdB family regulatory protein